MEKIYIAKAKSNQRGVRKNRFYPIIEILENESRLRIRNDRLEERTYKDSFFEICESIPIKDD